MKHINPFVRFFLMTSIAIVAFSCHPKETENSPTNDFIKDKIKGLSLEAPSVEFEPSLFEEFHQINANWVCLMPYAYSPEGENKIVYDLTDYQWWGERKEGITKSIEMAHSQNIQVMLKPHLWMGWNVFTGDLYFENEEAWTSWENDYEKYILDYAQVAETHHVELFCIGTELREFTDRRETFWRSLIKKVKSIYKGKLTYAGNWDSYKNFKFWDELDYIGVDAYFPLSQAEFPTEEELIKNWQPWIDEMKALSELHDKPILMTEYGYCSTQYNCDKPWEQDKNKEVSLKNQDTAYKAVFADLWKRDWMAGGFVWKWHTPNHLNESRMKKKFTPQGKTALETIKNAYKN